MNSNSKNRKNTRKKQEVITPPSNVEYTESSEDNGKYLDVVKRVKRLARDSQKRYKRVIFTLPNRKKIAVSLGAYPRFYYGTSDKEIYPSSDLKNYYQVAILRFEKGRRVFNQDILVITSSFNYKEALSSFDNLVKAVKRGDAIISW